MLRKLVKDAPDWQPEAGGTAADRRNARFVRIEIFDGDERKTAIGHPVRAHPLHAMTKIPVNARHAGIVYGAIMEELTSPGGVGELGVFVQSGTSGGGCATERRLRMIELRDMAWRVIRKETIILAPKRAARKAKGEAVLGQKRRAVPARGTMQDPRRPVTARALLDQVCVEGASLSDVLAAHGWEPGRRARGELSIALHGILGVVSDAWNGAEARLSGGWEAELQKTP